MCFNFVFFKTASFLLCFMMFIIIFFLVIILFLIGSIESGYEIIIERENITLFKFLKEMYSSRRINAARWVKNRLL